MIYEIYKGFIIIAHNEQDRDTKRYRIQQNDVHGFAYVGSSVEKLEMFCKKKQIDIELFEPKLDGLDEAIAEEDVMSLRDTLKDISNEER